MRILDDVGTEGAPRNDKILKKSAESCTFSKFVIKDPNHNQISIKLSKTQIQNSQSLKYRKYTYNQRA